MSFLFRPKSVVGFYFLKSGGMRALFGMIDLAGMSEAERLETDSAYFNHAESITLYAV